MLQSVLNGLVRVLPAGILTDPALGRGGKVGIVSGKITHIRYSANFPSDKAPMAVTILKMDPGVPRAWIP